MPGVVGPVPRTCRRGPAIRPSLVGGEPPSTRPRSVPSAFLGWDVGRNDHTDEVGPKTPRGALSCCYLTIQRLSSLVGAKGRIFRDSASAEIWYAEPRGRPHGAGPRRGDDLAPGP